MIQIGILNENDVLVDYREAESFDASVVNDVEIAKTKGYPTIGYSYNREFNAFVPPKPYPSYVLDEENFWWNPPVPHPGEGDWYWDEANLSWSEEII